jgi:putative PIN family toxin of toxin-antitoxin system
MVYAVIDTNVIVASLRTKHHDSATARVMDAVFSGKVVPLLNDEIIAEYRDVLHRKRLGLNPEKCDFIISLITDLGMTLDRISTNASMVDEKDRVFYEIALAGLDMGNSKLVTGNTKHYPEVDFVVTPAQFCEIMGI